jgi:hypothetical protein
MSQAGNGAGSNAGTLSGDAKMTLHDHDGVRICVREAVQDGRNGRRHIAELTVLGANREVAVLDARSPEELAIMVESALPCFAAAVRLRRASNP